MTEAKQTQSYRYNKNYKHPTNLEYLQNILQGEKDTDIIRITSIRQT